MNQREGPPAEDRDVTPLLGAVVLGFGALHSLFCAIGFIGEVSVFGPDAPTESLILLIGALVGVAAVKVGARAIWLACHSRGSEPRTTDGQDWRNFGRVVGAAVGAMLGALAASFTGITTLRSFVWALLVLPLTFLGMLTGAWLQRCEWDERPVQGPHIPPEVEATMRERFHVPGEQEGIQEARSPQVRRGGEAQE